MKSLLPTSCPTQKLKLNLTDTFPTILQYFYQLVWSLKSDKSLCFAIVAKVVQNILLEFTVDLTMDCKASKQAVKFIAFL